MSQLYKLAIELAIAAAVVIGAFAAGHHGGYAAGRDLVQGRWDKANAVASATAASAATASTIETQRRADAAQEIDRATQTAQAHDLDAARRGAAAAERLRLSATAAAARGGGVPGDPAAAQQCASDKAALAERLSQCGERYQWVDAAWRSLYTTAYACERAYDSLTAAP